MIWKVHPHELHFHRPAKTSRDTLISKQIWFLHLIENNQVVGIGEVAPIFGLSKENNEDVKLELERIQSEFTIHSAISSVQCAMEMALSARDNGSLYAPFCGNASLFPIPINGLVWMNELEEMRKQAYEKIEEGNRCIKLKIGALNIDDELTLIAELRSKWDASELTIRVDANGAFTAAEALGVLQRLADLQVHSIEQPIKAGQTAALFELASKSPVPIALDEELIGRTPKQLTPFLAHGKPQFLVIKPSLHGGFSATLNWIIWAKENGIDFWLTSALESNVGLNAIARWICEQRLTGVQGLGTGGLFTNNTEAFWKVEGPNLIPMAYA